MVNGGLIHPGKFGSLAEDLIKAATGEVGIIDKEVNHIAVLIVGLDIIVSAEDFFQFSNRGPGAVQSLKSKFFGNHNLVFFVCCLFSVAKIRIKIVFPNKYSKKLHFFVKIFCRTEFFVHLHLERFIS